MKRSDTFNSLRNQDHSASFDELGSWLGQQPKNPQKMNTIYKIAASFTATVMLLIACAVPVETEEEIGYMIRGMATIEAFEVYGNLAEFGIDPEQVMIQEVVHEEIGTGDPMYSTEIIMLLPEADLRTVEMKSQTLESIFDFTSINILPIEEKVERTLFENALHFAFDVKINPDLTGEQIEQRVNTFLHENSSITEAIEVKKDADGNRHAVFVLEMGEEGKYEVKRDIEQLYNDLTPENNEFISDDDVQELKEAEENQ